MMIVTKQNITQGKYTIHKGVTGSYWAISNSDQIKKAYPDFDSQPGDWFYICSFPDVPEILCSLAQIEPHS